MSALQTHLLPSALIQKHVVSQRLTTRVLLRMAVQAQWNLEGTLNSASSFACGILQAATNDNVQPLAIEACERFGNTLAMCHETCHKITNTVTPTPPHAVIRFLRARVGFSEQDSASQLGKSLAGVQFLGLAAAVVTTFGAFHGGMALEALLKAAAADRTLLPTAKQLKHLLESLEPRCHKAGFAEELVGWQLLLPKSPKLRDDNYMCVPSSEGLEALVDTFRQLCRIGEDTVTTAVIRAYSCAAWVVAFTKWCLGCSPSIYLANETPLLENSSSKVTVVVLERPEESDMEIKIHHSIQTLTSLVHFTKGSPVMGMVSIETYGRLLRQKLAFGSGDGYLKLVQVLPYAIQQIIASLNSQHPKAPTIQAKGLFQQMLSPFPSAQAITNILRRLLNTEFDLSLSTPEENVLIEDLPVVQSVKRDCNCSSCSDRVDPRNYAHCSKKVFFKRLGAITADILALSLFHDSESLLVQVRTGLPKYGNIATILEGRPGKFHSLSILQRALYLVGHVEQVDPPNRKDDWVASCFNGQTIYPTIYETYCIEKSGYMALSWTPGMLQYNGESYHHVRGSTDRKYNVDDSIPVGYCKEEVRQPLNLLREHRLAWRITVETDCLDITLGIKDKSGERFRPTHYGINGIFENLAGAIFLETCPHGRNAKLKTADKSAIYRKPLENLDRDPRFAGDGKFEEFDISVVAVDGADDLRLLALCYAPTFSTRSRPMVIRQDACISCCINVCRQAECRILIL